MSGAAPACWFDVISTYCEPGKKLGATNTEIQSASRFDGHERNYLDWPDPDGNGPSHDIPKNAYHVRYLAEEMAKRKRWIGEPLEVNESGYPIDGHHRIRAVKYLYDEHGILIPEPPEILIYLRGRSHFLIEPRPDDAIIRGAVELLFETERLVAAIDAAIEPEPAARWFHTPHSALDNRSPLALLQQGDFKRVWGVVRGLQPSASTQSLEDG